VHTGYILKISSPQKLIESLQEFIQGGSPMNPGDRKKAVMRFKNKRFRKTKYHLTPKEQKILELMSRDIYIKKLQGIKRIR
jgi:DNA-binding NarL/FixJ family response regulator